VRLLHILPALALLSACSPSSVRDSWINRVGGNTLVAVQGTSYNATFLPLAAPPGREADAWVFGPNDSVPFTMEEGGIPAIQISRADGTPMTRADHPLAVAAANQGCVDRPGWTTAKATALARNLPGTTPNDHKGTGYLYKGAWTLLGVCQ